MGKKKESAVTEETKAQDAGAEAVAKSTPDVPELPQVAAGPVSGPVTSKAITGNANEDEDVRKAKAAMPKEERAEEVTFVGHGTVILTLPSGRVRSVAFKKERGYRFRTQDAELIAVLRKEKMMELPE